MYDKYYFITWNLEIFKWNYWFSLNLLLSISLYTSTVCFFVFAVHFARRRRMKHRKLEINLKNDGERNMQTIKMCTWCIVLRDAFANAAFRLKITSRSYCSLCIKNIFHILHNEKWCCWTCRFWFVAQNLQSIIYCISHLWRAFNSDTAKNWKTFFLTSV